MSYGRLFVGVILVGLGLVFVLDAADVVDAGDVIGSLWPLLFVLGAALMYVANPRRWLVPAVIFVLAIVLLLDTTGLVEVNVWEFIWPVILIVIGLSFLLGRTIGAREATGDDRVNQFVLFSAAEIANHSETFSGGSVSAVFGGAEVDLRGASLADGASLDVFTAFGGVEIFVPQGWNVVIHGFPLFGGFENATTKDRLEPGPPTLNISALALFGGIDVKH